MAQLPRLVCRDLDAKLEAGFDRIREELDVPIGFDDEVREQADTAAARGPQLPPGAGGTKITDRRDLPLITVDPPGSIDLDQAFAAEPHAASLLPGVERQALLWTIDLDGAGEIANANLERATVSSTRKMTYREAQTEIDAGADGSLGLLRTIGQLREERERERGAVSLQLPSQEIIHRNDSYELIYDESMPVEGWNAQISLMTGIAAARIMIDAGVGLLRTLPKPQKETIDRIRRTAKALDIDWPQSQSYADRVRDLHPDDPREAALLSAAARGLRGAGYVAFHNGELPELREHSAIASVYAHVTAPLRRVCDRFTNEIVLAACEDREAPEWATEALDELPEIMGKARQRDRALERTMVDFAESVVLEDRVGEVFSAVVTGRGRDDWRLMVRDPAVIASIRERDLELGSTINVRLATVNPDRRRLGFELA